MENDIQSWVSASSENCIFLFSPIRFIFFSDDWKQVGSLPWSSTGRLFRRVLHLPLEIPSWFFEDFSLVDFYLAMEMLMLLLLLLLLLFSVLVMHLMRWAWFATAVGECSWLMLTLLRSFLITIVIPLSLLFYIHERVVWFLMYNFA